MKILFVSTRKNSDPTERELYEMDLMIDVLGFDRSLFDLGLLTILGGTPKRFEVSMQDEYLAPIDYDEPCDLVALSAKTSCSVRAYEVAAEFRRRGKKVVLGGIHCSLRPEEALERVDYIVTGEAEQTWLTFLEDFEAGHPERRYDTAQFPPMSEVPFPSFGPSGRAHQVALHRRRQFHQSHALHQGTARGTRSPAQEGGDSGLVGRDHAQRRDGRGTPGSVP